MQRVGEAASGWIPPWFPDWDGPWSPFLPRKLILEERQQIPNDPWWNQPVPWAVRSDLGTLRYSGHQTRGFQDLRMIFERSSNQGCFNPSRTRRNLVIEILYITNCIYIYTYIYIHMWMQMVYGCSSYNFPYCLPLFHISSKAEFPAGSSLRTFCPNWHWRKVTALKKWWNWIGGTFPKWLNYSVNIFLMPIQIYDIYEFMKEKQTRTDVEAWESCGVSGHFGDPKWCHRFVFIFRGSCDRLLFQCLAVTRGSMFPASR